MAELATDEERAAAVEAILGGDKQCDGCLLWFSDHISVGWDYQIDGHPLYGALLCRGCYADWHDHFTKNHATRHTGDGHFDIWINQRRSSSGS